MSNLDADLGSFRTFGENVASLREGLQDYLGAESALLLGGSDGQFSTGLFPPGREAENATRWSAEEAQLFLGDAMQNLTVLSSVAHIIADLYGTGDAMGAVSLNAIKFAFDAPGATRPAGLPSHIDGTTVEELYDQQPAAGASDGGGQAPGSESGSTPDQREYTTHESYPHAGLTHTQHVTEIRDENGALVGRTIEHEYHHRDGTVEMHTERQDADGNSETSGHRTITPQPDAVTPDDWIALAEAQEQEAREQAPGL
ncbi:hypothetical protein DI005_23475 [Prauserella sp. PE36]|uniref:Uncharacterized protein n=1 Tax=Prauserella endophytica TaxID=1592324 RepID=A0ABY2SC66_9PSEU|nr:MULTISPECIES: hypothetical protein [Prauserella]PXY28919.1 hypothetical protein BAY59_14760 [Prauserella coralliicola]RBM17244.1 hypothetical protein DI005_23475 [Prauserella sp. PE36]TKG72600.1 hypothetical protein FCN18_04975 [Prauserella endophytica]